MSEPWICNFVSTEFWDIKFVSSEFRVLFTFKFFKSYMLVIYHFVKSGRKSCRTQASHSCLFFVLYYTIHSILCCTLYCGIWFVKRYLFLRLTEFEFIVKCVKWSHVYRWYTRGSQPFYACGLLHVEKLLCGQVT